MSQYKTVEFDLRGMGLVVVVGAWLVGILISSWVMLPIPGLQMGACAALLMLIPLWRDPLSRIVMLSVLCLLLGMWRYTYASPINDPQAVSNFISTNKVEVQGALQLLCARRLRGWQRSAFESDHRQRRKSLRNDHGRRRE